MTKGLRERLHELQARLNIAIDAVLDHSKAITAWSARLPLLQREEVSDWERQYNAFQQEYEKSRIHAETVSAEFSAALAAYKNECVTDYFPSD